MISILNFIFTLCYIIRDEQNKISFAYIFKNNLIYSIFENVYIYNKSRFMSIRANEPHYEL
jgi:hypothetical protein